MRTELEKKLAILSLNNEKKNIEEFDSFGSNNYTIINYGSHVIYGKLSLADLIDLRKGEMITDLELIQLKRFVFWLDKTNDNEFVKLLWNASSLITKTTRVKVCDELCEICPFSNQSPKGSLGKFTSSDLLSLYRNEANFGCQAEVKDKNMTIEDASDLVKEGKIKMCRGYIEMIAKSGYVPQKNKELIEVYIFVMYELSDHSMDLFEFIEHHNK